MLLQAFGGQGHMMISKSLWGANLGGQIRLAKAQGVQGQENREHYNSLPGPR